MGLRINKFVIKSVFDLITNLLSLFLAVSKNYYLKFFLSKARYVKNGFSDISVYNILGTKICWKLSMIE
jgi:hypothetical protein